MEARCRNIALTRQKYLGTRLHSSKKRSVSGVRPKTKLCRFRCDSWGTDYWGLSLVTQMPKFLDTHVRWPWPMYKFSKTSNKIFSQYTIGIKMWHKTSFNIWSRTQDHSPDMQGGSKNVLGLITNLLKSGPLMSCDKPNPSEQVRAYGDSSLKPNESRCKQRDINVGLPRYPYQAVSTDWIKINARLATSKLAIWTAFYCAEVWLKVFCNVGSECKDIALIRPVSPKMPGDPLTFP